MPSMPILSTPAFSEICSPRPASSSGTPAVTAPNSSEVRKASVSNPSIALSPDPLAALVIEIFDHRQEEEQQGHQHQHEMLRHADPARRAVAANHQHREEQGESDDR